MVGWGGLSINLVKPTMVSTLLKVGGGVGGWGGLNNENLGKGSPQINPLFSRIFRRPSRYHPQ